ncbi:hypothetical protein TNCV_3128671 [Trichonephila clavipes]|nr:hypothetical protein TNCV_3128671 [Trichonephila clavipes]
MKLVAAVLIRHLSKQMPESFILIEEKKRPAVCDCDEASLMTPNSPGFPSCEKCWMQVSPVPACEECPRSACLPFFPGEG